MKRNITRLLAVVAIGALAIGALAIGANSAAGQDGINRLDEVVPKDGAVKWDASVGVGGNWTVDLGLYFDYTDSTIIRVYKMDGDTPDPNNDTQIAASFENSPTWVNATWGDNESPPDFGANEWYIWMQDFSSDDTRIYGPFNVSIPGIEVRSESSNLNNVGNTIESTITTDVAESERQGVITVNGTTAIPLTSSYIDLAPLEGDSITVDLRDTGSTYADRTVTYASPVYELAYLASVTKNAVNVTFELEDRSGEFDAQTTSFRLEKTIGGEQRQIIGDLFGANGRVTSALVAGDRYRLVVKNEQGDQREFGQYLANIEGDLVELDVGELSLEPAEQGGYYFNAYETNAGSYAGNPPAIRYVWVDDGPNTQSLEVTIYEQGNESNQIHSQRYTDSNEVRTTWLLTTNQSKKSWVVEYNVTRETGDGETMTTTGFQTIGGLGDLNLPVSSQALTAISLGSILLTAGLFGGRLTQIGGIVVVGVAWVFWSIGWLSLPIEFLAAAAVVAVLFKVGTPDSGGIYS